MSKKDGKLSAPIARFAATYPDAVSTYTRVGSRHVVTLKPGWCFKTWSKRTSKARTSHTVSYTRIVDVVRALRFTQPCDCKLCVAADRGLSLLIWRMYHNLPLPPADFAPGAYRLFLIRDIRQRGDHVLIDTSGVGAEGLVELDVLLEKVQ